MILLAAGSLLEYLWLTSAICPTKILVHMLPSRENGLNHQISQSDSEATLSSV